MASLSVNFLFEKRNGLGEDAPPISIDKGEFYAVGVLDGMGGAGAAICKSEYGDNYTKAYVSSRIIADTIRQYLEKTENAEQINSNEITLVVKDRLEKEKMRYPSKASSLRSKFVRDYPTTLAITLASKIKTKNMYRIDSFWAGDSRNYLWSNVGFFQISKDDLATELDPFDNLKNDEVLSNCVCADMEFVINNINLEIADDKFIILSASDGCFNYFASPMHFEDVLLSCLKSSETLKDWEESCKNRIIEVTGDDASLSLIAIGFDDFNDLKITFENKFVEKMEEIKNIQEKIDGLTNQIEEYKTCLEQSLQEGWNEYKLSYLKYLSTERCNNISTEFDNKNNIR